MTMVQGTQSGTPTANLNALLQLAATQQGTGNTLDVKDLEESLSALRAFLAASGDSLLPDLEAPSSKSGTVSLSGLTMSGLSSSGVPRPRPAWPRWRPAPRNAP